MKTKLQLAALALFLSIINYPLSTAFAQGSLTPPDAPAPTFKTLAQVEPRTPISSLPITITNSGSYYLTTNLTGNPGGITIDSSGVTLDLMGFELVGGTGVGIFVNTPDFGRTNIAVRNGTVRSWSGHGIDANFAVSPQLESLRVSGNGTHGIRTGPGSLVTGCTAFGNSSNGIVVDVGSKISNCAARKNAGDGIQAADGSEVSACIATDNTGDGIEVHSSCHVRDNTCYGNGITGAGGAGVHVTGDANRIDGNHVGSGRYGIKVDSSGNLIIRNSARGVSTNYLFNGTQSFGPTNQTSGLVTNHPWANFSF